LVIYKVHKFYKDNLIKANFYFRIENVTKSPVLSHITASIHGLSTIKAYKKEQDFFDKYVNNGTLFTLLEIILIKSKCSKQLL